MQLLEKTDRQHSDLLPGVYEGGLKVWECAFDLLEYLVESGMEFSGSRVLDLGCGNGLLGIFALLNGAEEVHFQDYNPEVIECLTMVNVIANCANDCSYTVAHTSPCAKVDKSVSFPEQAQKLADKCKFFSGDWTEFCYLLNSAQPPQPLYDIILTSETIYCADAQPKLLQVLKRFTSPNGIVLMAAKAHYFGVGGSLLAFRELVESDGVLDYTVVKEICASVVRQVVQLRYRM